MSESPFAPPEMTPVAKDLPVVPAGATAYRYDAAALAVLQKRLRSRIAASSTFTVVVIVVSMLVTSRGQNSWWSSLIGGTVGTVIMAVTSFRSYRRQLEQLRTFTLTTDDAGLRRTIDGYPTVEIRFADLRRLHETARGLAAHGADRTVIGAARELPGYEALRDRLQAARPIEPETRRRWAGTTAGLALAIATLVALWVRDREIALIATVLAIVGQAVMGVLVWNSTHIDLRTRAALRVMYPLLLLWFITRAYRLATGG